MGEALMSGGAGGSGTIYKWKRYELNTTTRYTWNKWSLNSTTTYKWNKYDTGWQAVYSKSDTTSLNDGNSYVYDSYTFRMTGSSGFEYMRIEGSGRVTIASYDIKDSIIGKYAESSYSNIHRLSSFWKREYISNFGAWYLWYYTDSLEPVKGKGSTSYGQVTSTSSSAYPSNGTSGSYWYESAGSSTSYSRGSYVGTVSSSSSSSYPNGSWSGSYWYDGRSGGTTHSQGAAAGTVYNTNRNAYPDNSYTGSYWYVFDGEA